LSYLEYLIFPEVNSPIFRPESSRWPQDRPLNRRKANEWMRLMQTCQTIPKALAAWTTIEAQLPAVDDATFQRLAQKLA
jgi:hypothetical protein